MASAAEGEAKCGSTELLQDIFGSTHWRCWCMRLRCRQDEYRGEVRQQFEILECKNVDYVGGGAG